MLRAAVFLKAMSWGIIPARLRPAGLRRAGRQDGLREKNTGNTDRQPSELSDNSDM